MRARSCEEALATVVAQALEVYQICQVVGLIRGSGEFGLDERGSSRGGEVRERFSSLAVLW